MTKNIFIILLFLLFKYITLFTNFYKKKYFLSLFNLSPKFISFLFLKFCPKFKPNIKVKNKLLLNEMKKKRVREQKTQMCSDSAIVGAKFFNFENNINRTSTTVL